jgi:transcriptional regulator with GAF, ATPase, and Fis domain
MLDSERSPATGMGMNSTRTLASPDDPQRQLAEAVAQQRATSEILRLISQTHETAQPVFETIAAAALRLCDATAANVFTFDGELLHVAALAVVNASAADGIRAAFPRAPNRGTVASRAVLMRRVVSIPDVLQDPDFAIGKAAAAAGFRSNVGIPLMHAGRPIGAIAVGRAEPGPFPEHQLALLQTFADQAVIAIENARLFIALRQEIEGHRKSKATIHVLLEEIASGRDAMVGNSPALQRVRAQIAQVCRTDSTVLIQGETGSGKELVAHAIHAESRRSEGPLIKLNCAALPRELVESELFGHERGAFTGATQQRRGRFELADHGTLFLDEVGELPVEAQAKLLRVLQDGEFERLGGARSLRTDVRLIAATNRDLHGEVEAGRFRADLYYRLNVFPITLPPLRERRDDIPALVRHFASKAARKLGRPPDAISPEFIEKARTYDWPGNIRELENLVERALIMGDGQAFSVAERASQGDGAARRQAMAPDSLASLEEIERAHIRQVLQEVSWKIEGNAGAARILGLKPSTLRARLHKLGIRKPA